MRTFDQRFKPRANPAVVAHLDELPSGAEVRVRAVVFVKAGRQWSNDFRAGMTSAEVASCLVEGDYTITPNPVKACDIPCGSNTCEAYQSCALARATPKES